MIMKKSLITLAFMSAFATSAFAEVSVYGMVDAGIQSVKSGNTSVVGLESGLANESRIGFKGTEELGNGLAVNFVLEQGFNLDNGTPTEKGSAFNRQSWVGLKTKDLGEIRLGRQLAIMDRAVDELDPFGGGFAGNAVNFLGYGSYLQRINNAITYIAPSVAGLTTTIQYGFGETPGSMSDNRVLGFNLGYSRGELEVNLSYNNQKFNGLSFDEKQTDVLLGAAYDFHVAKAYLGYGQSKFEDVTNNTSMKVKNFLAGVSAPISENGTVMASYLHSNVTSIDNAKSNQFAIGYTHDLSKRTKLYTSYAYVSNDANAGINAVANGENTRIINVGINHTF